MSNLSDIEPKDKPNVIDLLKDAGIDVSDWAKKCKTPASRNGRYCYEWAFAEPNKVVVLNLWHDDIEEGNDSIVSRFVHNIIVRRIME